MSQAALQTALLELQNQAAASVAQAQAFKQAAQAQLGQRSSPRLQPSGPRAKGDGVDDEAQAILRAERAPSGGVVLKISLLAAGFLVGPSGASIRGVSAATGADIHSQTTTWQGRRVREMHVQGEPRAVVAALALISAAVGRYAELTSGAYAAVAVDREQLISGVTFFYSPPPRAAVPYAASLRAPHERPASPPAARKRFGVSLSVPPSAGKENRLASALMAAVQAQGVQAQRTRSGGAHAAAPGVLSPRLGLATPVAPRAGGTSGHLLAALSGAAPAGMEVDGEEAATPAYATAPTGGLAGGAPFAALPAAAPVAPAYSLWGPGAAVGTPLGLGAQQADPFAAPASAFASAFEVAPAPPACGPLSRSPSLGEDALLAACGILPPPYSAFAQQASAYQPGLLAHQPAPAAPLARLPSLTLATPAVTLPAQLDAVGTMPGWPGLSY